jgi:hypothetical protein
MRVAAPSPSIGLRQTAAKISTAERRDQAPQFGGIETPLNLDPKTLGQYNPKLSIPRLACRPSPILNDLDGNNPFPASILCSAPAPCIKRVHG